MSATETAGFTLVATDRGDIVELRDASGASFAAYRYDSWGLPLGTVIAGTAAVDAATAAKIASIASVQPIRHAGYCYDEHAGLYYLSARSYDPATRQFLTKDPVKADGEESAYQYCGGDPVGKVDPSGLGVYWVALHSLHTASTYVVSAGATYVIELWTRWSMDTSVWAGNGSRLAGTPVITFVKWRAYKHSSAATSKTHSLRVRKFVVRGDGSNYWTTMDSISLTNGSTAKRTVSAKYSYYWLWAIRIEKRGTWGWSRLLQHNYAQLCIKRQIRRLPGQAAGTLASIFHEGLPAGLKVPEPALCHGIASV